MALNNPFKTSAESSEFDWKNAYQQWAEEAPEGPLKRFYQAGCVAPSTRLRDAPLMGLDIETTGLNSKEDEIISLGIMPFDHTIIRCQGAQYWITKPDNNLHAESVTIHEITDTELGNAPPLEGVLEKLLTAMSGKLMVVHCVAIERQFLLEAALKVYGYPLYFPVLDTMDIERQAYQPKWWQRFSKAPSLRLDACRQRYNLPRYKAHHALTDALSSAELLQAQIAYHLNPQRPVQQYWL
ncbi:3'-5' exonuclease [Marinomonas epiphytica]